MCAQVREVLAETMRRVVDKVTSSRPVTEEVLNERVDLTQHHCYQAAVNHYKYNCFNWHKAEVELKQEPGTFCHLWLNSLAP